REFGDFIDWEELVAEGYIILNPECKAAKLSEAKSDLDEEDVIAYARMAENFFRLPILYLEYSGMYGDVNLVAAVKYELNQTRLFYGGGIESAEQAAAMAKFADAVVVGNIIYENIESAIETVKAVKDAL
ncbi:MAG: heptaprenylglyceryl phosphate synthase, partial [Kurthia sp.]